MNLLLLMPYVRAGLAPSDEEKPWFMEVGALVKYPFELPGL